MLEHKHHFLIYKRLTSIALVSVTKFGKNPTWAKIKSLAISMVYIAFGKNFNPHRQIFNAIGQLFIIEISQILSKLSSHLVTLVSVHLLI